MENIITKEKIQKFQDSLYNDEKAKATVDKYVGEIWRLYQFLGSRGITKPLLLEYREELQKRYKAQSVNGALSAINAYLEFYELSLIKVKLLRVQRKAFVEEEKELSETEYKRLLQAAKDQGNERLYMIMMTLCGTGIRIGELSYITVEAVKSGRAEINMKGKNRVIILPKKLRNRLMYYAAMRKIQKGCIFRTKNGHPVNRSNICHEMKKLCQEAAVEPKKVFPHNFRHLFARTFYAIEKNLAHLADVLGHSRIETTRIYVAVSASAHERILQKMSLIL